MQKIMFGESGWSTPRNWFSVIQNVLRCFEYKHDQWSLLEDMWDSIFWKLNFYPNPIIHGCLVLGEVERLGLHLTDELNRSKYRVIVLVWISSWFLSRWLHCERTNAGWTILGDQANQKKYCSTSVTERDNVSGNPENLKLPLQFFLG